MLKKLTESQCKAAMAAGEFESGLRGSEPRVAIILTQGWCPQWTMMKSWLPAVSESPGMAIYYVEYDNEPFYEAFMAFKEDGFGNREIPYIRYYRDGDFLKASNYLDKASFLRILGL
jgi:hypothetical protein